MPFLRLLYPRTSKIKKSLLALDADKAPPLSHGDKSRGPGAKIGIKYGVAFRSCSYKAAPNKLIRERANVPLVPRWGKPPDIREPFIIAPFSRLS